MTETPKSLGMDDLKLLALDTMIWYNVSCEGSVPVGRYMHAATVAVSKMLIFGGMNAMEYCPPELIGVELSKI